MLPAIRYASQFDWRSLCDGRSCRRYNKYVECRGLLRRGKFCPDSASPRNLWEYRPKRFPRLGLQKFGLPPYSRTLRSKSAIRPNSVLSCSMSSIIPSLQIHTAHRREPVEHRMTWVARPSSAGRLEHLTLMPVTRSLVQAPHAALANWSERSRSNLNQPGEIGFGNFRGGGTSPPSFFCRTATLGCPPLSGANLSWVKRGQPRVAVLQ